MTPSTDGSDLCPVADMSPVPHAPFNKRASNHGPTRPGRARSVVRRRTPERLETVGASWVHRCALNREISSITSRRLRWTQVLATGPRTVESPPLTPSLFSPADDYVLVVSRELRPAPVYRDPRCRCRRSTSIATRDRQRIRSAPANQARTNAWRWSRTSWQTRWPAVHCRQVLKTPGVSALNAELARGILSRQLEIMSRLVNDLVDGARITQGKMDLRRAPADLNAVLRRALEDVAHLVDGGKNRSRCWCRPSPGTCSVTHSARASFRQPAEQRLQVHPQGRTHLAERRERPDPGWRGRGRRAHSRRGDRHHRRDAATRLRPLHSSGSLTHRRRVWGRTGARPPVVDLHGGRVSLQSAGLARKRVHRLAPVASRYSAAHCRAAHEQRPLRVSPPVSCPACRPAELDAA